MLQRILLGTGGKRYHQAATPTAKGLLRANPSRQLVAIHPRHHAVGNHDVEVFALPTFECFLSIFRGGRPVPKAFQLHGQGQTIEWDGLPQQDRERPCLIPFLDLPTPERASAASLGGGPVSGRSNSTEKQEPSPGSPRRPIRPPIRCIKRRLTHSAPVAGKAERRKENHPSARTLHERVRDFFGGGTKKGP